jgi:dipeptidyl aminopeptidase/acylaminoacyl peptidase
VLTFPGRAASPAAFIVENMLMSRTFFAAIAVLGLLAGAPVRAQKGAADIPVADFFKRAEYQSVALSPDGTKLAAISPLKGRGNLVVVDLEKRTRNVITSFETRDVANFTWINNERLFFRVADSQDASGVFNYKGSYAINWDGSEVRDLTRLVPVSRQSTAAYSNVVPLARTNDQTGDIYFAARERRRDASDVYRYNTKTGKLELLTFDSPSRTQRWILDWNYVPRVTFAEDKGLGSVWYRDAAPDSKWVLLHEGRIGTESLTPLAFDFDNKTLFVSTNIGRDKMAIYKYDPVAKKLGELMFEDPVVDIEGGLVFSRGQKRLLGIRYNAGMPVVKWLDPEMDGYQKAIDKALPGTRNALLREDDARRMLVVSGSDTDPGRHYLFDLEKKSLEALPPTRPWLKPELMAERKFITYKARDGMTIPAYLTLPRGSDGKNLPLVVNIHGGPWTRAYQWIEWGRWPEAQFFASRGYAVLEPEPRGSTGWGRKHFESSFKQLGLAMQDDITDGALHLVKEGIVDKARICLHGGSYGGYATLQGLVREPDMFRCGTPFVAVTDLGLWQTVQWSDTAQQTDFFETDYIRMVGDSKADAALFDKSSPARNADRIKAPVLLVMGEADVRVPLIHGETMRDALKKAGKNVEFVTYEDEGHGFNKQDNVVDFYTRIEKFLATHLK